MIPTPVEPAPTLPRNRGEASLAAALCLLLRLTRREGRLLAKLVSRDFVGTDSTVKTHISTLRSKLKLHDIGITTLAGIGYALDGDARSRVRDILARHDTELRPHHPPIARKKM